MFELGVTSIEMFFKKYLYAESIRSHLLRFFVLLVLVPTVAISLTSAILGWRNGRQRVVDQLQLAAKFKTSEIESWTHTLTKELQSVLSQSDTLEIIQYMLRWHQQAEEETPSADNLITGLVTEMEWRFKRYVVQNQDFKHILLINLKGKVIASTIQPKGEVNASDFRFQKALEGPYVHVASADKFAPLDQTAVVVGIPIFKEGQGPGDPDHTIQGVLIGQVSAEMLNDIMLAQNELGKTGETYLVNQDYVPLTPLKASDEQDQPIDGAKVETPGSRKAIEDHEDGFGFYRGYRGQLVVGVYRWLPDVEVALLAEQDQAEAFRAIYQTLGVNIGVALLSVVGAVITATFIAQRIATPLINLSETATKIADGDLEQRAEVQGKNEIKTLAHAFNRMTTRLRAMLHSEEIRRVELEREIAERERAEAERERLLAEQAALQQEVIEAQREALRDLSTPVIPIMERILVLPLIGSIDSMRARDIMRSLLEGISKHRAKVVILDMTGVPVMDTAVVNHLNKTIQAARLKGAHTIVTGISDAVAEAVVDLGVDWRQVETLRDLQTGLRVALARMDIQL